MTKDEAIAAFNGVNTSSFAASAWIARFVALGMLKLDEPKDDLFQEFKKAMAELGYGDNSCVWRDIPAALKNSGLKFMPRKD